jgi:hypothetical protein
MTCFAQDLTQSTGRAIACRDSLTLKFTIKDKDNNAIDLSSVTVGQMDIKSDLDESALVSKTIGSGMTIDPDQSENKGVLRVDLSGGAAGDTDRDAGIHFYDAFIELAGKRQYFVKPQSKIEFIDVVTQ